MLSNGVFGRQPRGVRLHTARVRNRENRKRSKTSTGYKFRIFGRRAARDSGLRAAFVLGSDGNRRVTNRTRVSGVTVDRCRGDGPTQPHTRWQTADIGQCAWESYPTRRRNTRSVTFFDVNDSTVGRYKQSSPGGCSETTSPTRQNCYNCFFQ